MCLGVAILKLGRALRALSGRGVLSGNSKKRVRLAIQAF